MYDDLTSHQKAVTKGYKQQQKTYNVRFCEACKYKIEQDSSFCSNCGKEVKIVRLSDISWQNMTFDIEKVNEIMDV